MKNLINIAFISLAFVTVTVAQSVNDQNPNFENSLKKYEIKKDMAGAQQSVTLQETYEVTDWREVKAEEKKLKAERKHELKKMRIERDAQNRRLYNNNYGRYNRYNHYNY